MKQSFAQCNGAKEENMEKRISLHPDIWVVSQNNFPFWKELTTDSQNEPDSAAVHLGRSTYDGTREGKGGWHSHGAIIPEGGSWRESAVSKSM